ncbi:hypothetical protein NAT51_08205 [Flavobacterium amniphilum]|uniref:hypothetical protein n=1 Tax=Flavobacterium amniphilum TaxID=1834035 RepID=UPI00202AAE01|nr:hypothetical protein [Flavobacterium amniphilum]MCL9805501.1 hypothetical protein [Flavobacterium amniphilum]
MKTLGEFEIHDTFPINTKPIITGRLISGGPISNKKDILLKDIYITFSYNDTIITAKIIELTSPFMRLHMDIIIEVGDNIALVLETNNETEALGNVTFSPVIVGTIIHR